MKPSDERQLPTPPGEMIVESIPEEDELHAMIGPDEENNVLTLDKNEPNDNPPESKKSIESTTRPPESGKPSLVDIN